MLFGFPKFPMYHNEMWLCLSFHLQKFVFSSTYFNFKWQNFAKIHSFRIRESKSCRWVGMTWHLGAPKPAEAYRSQSWRKWRWWNGAVHPTESRSCHHFEWLNLDKLVLWLSKTVQDMFWIQCHQSLLLIPPTSDAPFACLLRRLLHCNSVHFSFNFRLLLPVGSHFSGDLSLEMANPVTPHTSFETHRRASQAVSAPSGRPWYVCFLYLRYFKSFVFKIINLSTGEVFRRDMMI